LTCALFRIGSTFTLGALDCRGLDKDALAFVAPSRPAESYDNGGA
jgi:hypothetical protein